MRKLVCGSCGKELKKDDVEFKVGESTKIEGPKSGDLKFVNGWRHKNCGGSVKEANE